jgi:hypothetical protein
MKEWNTSKDGFKDKTQASAALLLKLREQQGVQQQQESVDVTLQNFQEETKKDIQKLRSWAKVKVRNMILKEAQRRRLKILGTEELVTELSHLNDIFEADGTLATAEQLWYCFFGIFDKVESWEILLEKEYMEEHKIGYRECREGTKKSCLRSKGCIAQIVRTVKNGMVDVLNRRATKEESHGNKLGITREEEEVSKHKDGRRHYGVFQPFCYRDNNKKTVTKDPVMKNPSSPVGKSKRRKTSSDIPRYVSDITQVSRSSSLHGSDCADPEKDPEKELLRKELERVKALLAEANKNTAIDTRIADKVPEDHQPRVVDNLVQNPAIDTRIADKVPEDHQPRVVDNLVLDSSEYQPSSEKATDDLEYQPSEYELRVMAKTKRNMEYMSSLGLGQTKKQAKKRTRKEPKAKNNNNEKRHSTRLNRTSGGPVSLHGMLYFPSLMIVDLHAAHHL